MFSNSRKRELAVPTAVLAVLIMLCASVVAFSGSSEATGEDLTGYGTVSEIQIAPGYSWSYTATFPSDLTEGTVLSFAVNELNTNASISGHNVSIIIPTGFASGAYNVVLKAEHAASGQTAYQWIRITVNEALSLDYSGCITEIVQGTAQNITLTATGGIGTVTWTATSLPQGLTLSNNVISGTPTTIGQNTIQVKATSDKGETRDLEIQFTVFNKIVGGEAQTITAAGAYAASSAVVQTGTDLGVTWAVTSGTLPAGFALDASTGVVSGTYTGTEPVESTVTITGTAQNGPEQTATKQITIRAEPAFALAGDASALTYTGNTADKTVSVSSNASTSAIAWTVSAIAGVSIDQSGVVTVTGAAPVGMSQSITVTATTAYGQIKEHQIVLNVEDKLTITGPATLVSTASQSASTTAYTIAGGSGNQVAITANGGFSSGLAYDSDANTLSVSYPEAHAGMVTLTVTSAAGQTATIDVDVTVYSSMGFTSEPGASGHYAYIVDEA